MFKFFQTEWLGIRFSEFIDVNSSTLAGAEFYDAFYRALFSKYPNYDALDVDWRRNKDEITGWLATSLPDGARVLSVGCGLGYMEQRLWRQHGERIELHVQDYASQALQWLRQVLPQDRIHDVVGGEIGEFDLIYLSAVDYAMPDADLIDLIGSLRSRLRSDGTLLMISASYLDESAGQQFVGKAKDGVKWLLDTLGIRHRGQFWGWMRTRLDYQTVMRNAGFHSITDGFIKTKRQQTYWVQSCI